MLEQQISESDTTSGEVGGQRERNHRYWSLQPLGNEQRGRSHYIDPRVFAAVESKKGVFSETFLSNRQVVRFNGANQDESDAKSAYVQKVLKSNDYHALFRDGWHDAFVAKRMTVWVDWRRNHEPETFTFSGAPEAAVNAALSKLDIVELVESTLETKQMPTINGGQQVFVTGEITVLVNRGYLELDLIQPEYVMRDPSQSYCGDAMWNSARMDISRVMLVEWGFDPGQVAQLDSDYRWGSNSEDYARKQHDGSFSTANSQRGDQQEVTIYKTRTWLSPEDFDSVAGLEEFEPESGAAIYEIYWGLGKIMNWADGTPAIKPMYEMAVYEWSEFKVSHAENGMCTADVEAHQQKAGSQLKRGVIDNQNITNNPRWEANVGALRDARDLYDNAIGGVIETDDGIPVGQVKALAQPQLSPVVFGVMQMLDKDSESRSGMSDLARGMNQGAITNQNSASMIERLSSAGSRRTAMSARDFATTFMVPMMQCIVKIATQYDKSSSVTESGGRPVQIVPASWGEDSEMEVEVALTPEEAQTMAKGLIMMNGQLSADEEMKPLYGLQQKHALWDTVYELIGVKDSTKFLAAPETPGVQQMLAARTQSLNEQREQQNQALQFQRLAAEDQLRLGWASLNNTMIDKQHDNDLADDKFDADTYFREQELKLEREQKRGASI
jgi:hypothetical protein